MFSRPSLQQGLLAALLFVLPSASFSQGINERSPIKTGYLYDFKSDIDGGGEVSSHFFHVSGGIPIIRKDNFFTALSGAYYLNDYSFSGGSPGSFASLSPWDAVHTFRISSYSRWKFAENWEAFGIPSIRSIGESSASFDDTLTWGTLAGVSYRFNENLKIGPGFGYIRQIEDDASIFPFILLDWQISDQLSLTTGPSVGATLGPGLSLNYDIADDLRLTFGARYEKLRFRLDENSKASPGGVGEDRSIPVFAAVTWKATDILYTSLIGGVGFGNELKLEDGGGRSIVDRDYDPAPFLGVNFRLTF